MLRASALVERQGIPAVSIVTDAFVPIARAIADAEGINRHPLAVMPHVIMTQEVETIRATAKELLVDQIVNGLRSATLAGPSPAGEGESFDRTAVVASGTIDEVFEAFERRGWGDGLPFVPPTVERIEAFLANTPRQPDEVIGVLPPANCVATIWNTAVNGVMAGCRPEYMPLLIAIVEAVADPGFRLQDGGSTPGWEPLVIVSGPIVEALDFNVSTGAMRVGRRANTTVGRFLRLVLCNVAGLRIPPGSTDKGTIGMPTNVALAENEKATRNLGWPSFAEERGFRSDESVVTVQSVVGVSPPIYSGGSDPEEHARTLAEVAGNLWSYKAWDGLYFGELHHLLVISPGIAEVLARGGWDKQSLRRHLKENIVVTVESLLRYAWQASGIALDLDGLVDQGMVEAVYRRGQDLDRRVPAMRENATLGVVVAGDAGRNQSRAYAQQHRQGPPVSRRVTWT